MGKLAQSTNTFTKNELIQIFLTSKRNKERNRALKGLKKYEPVADFQYDGEVGKERLKAKQYEKHQAFICGRCDRPFYAMQKASYQTSAGQIVVCMPCYNQLKDIIETRKLLKEHQRQGL